MQAARTGPSHSSTAGTTRPLVFWLCAGPTTITDCSGSAATRRPLMRPSTTRPGCAARTYRSRNSCGRAQPPGPVWPPAGVECCTTTVVLSRRRSRRKPCMRYM